MYHYFTMLYFTLFKSAEKKLIKHLESFYNKNKIKYLVVKRFANFYN